MVRHKSVGKLIPRDGQREQLRDAIAQEGLLQDLAHARTLLRLLDQHIGNDAL